MNTHWQNLSIMFILEFDNSESVAIYPNPVTLAIVSCQIWWAISVLFIVLHRWVFTLLYLFTYVVKINLSVDALSTTYIEIRLTLPRMDMGILWLIKFSPLSLSSRLSGIEDSCYFGTVTTCGEWVSLGVSVSQCVHHRRCSQN